MHHPDPANEAVAQADPDRWRKLYETEAQQRRSDVQTLQAQIAELKAALTLRKTLAEPDPSRVQRLQQQVCRIQEPLKLQRLLVEAATECERLRLTLTQEQLAHRHTRESLMATLSDAVAELRERSKHQNAAPTPKSS